MSTSFSQSPARLTINTNDPQLKKRIEYLANEMKDIDVNHDDYISREELYQYLDRKVFLFL